MPFKTYRSLSSKRGLTGLDWTIIVVYLGSMIGVGVYWYLRDRQGTASEFFLGSRSIPFWAAGVSLYATNTSSISYIAIPAKAFETDWQYMMNKLITIVGLMFVAVWIVPLLRRLDLVSVFNYLEMRFHPAIRMIGSALCMAMHVGGRMSVVLFLPALAIATITGIDVVMQHPDHGRVHDRLHRDGRHARGGVDRLRAGHRADGRRGVRHLLRVQLARAAMPSSKRRRPSTRPSCSTSASISRSRRCGASCS